jgi:hypothetical protein
MKDTVHLNEAVHNVQRGSSQDLPSSEPTQESGESDYLFRSFLSGDKFRKGLQLQFEPFSNLSLSQNWLVVDLDPIERGSSESGSVSLALEDEYFDKVLCTGLDRIARPASLIAEVRRVLKRGGQIWVQAPLNKACRPETNDHHPVYWQFTPKGFQVLFERFDEIICSIRPTATYSLKEDSFFYGIKPEICPEKPEDQMHPALPLPPL